MAILWSEQPITLPGKTQRTLRATLSAFCWNKGTRSIFSFGRTVVSTQMVLEVGGWFQVGAGSWKAGVASWKVGSALWKAVVASSKSGAGSTTGAKSGAGLNSGAESGTVSGSGVEFGDDSGTGATILSVDTGGVAILSVDTGGEAILSVDTGGLECKAGGLECVAAGRGFGMPAARAEVSGGSSTLDNNPLLSRTGP
ncbi:fibroin heavy chain-like isoform X3 [Megalobrama amblycephala]|uniref:fibroin heavy chain-like isoform X3 n=1 Tax=Megalobrama amblycephala TaxID=75352 RepID=UPI00201440D0|nr:fibroin heavy chain-like isoform X3 [Megalobrama amblycephala]